MPPVTRNLTILLTDIKGFTDKTSHKSRSQIQAMLDKHKELVLPVLESKGGKLVKTIGDAFLMVYESPTDAVLAGIAVQEALTRYNADKTSDDRIEVRIAINQGEVNVADNDIFGEPVNITARIEGVAEAGEVFFTEAVYLAMNKNEVPSSEVGLLQLKGIREKIKVYKFKREHPIEGMAQPAAKAPPAPLSPGAPESAAKAPPAFSAPPAKAGVPLAQAAPSLFKRGAALLMDVVVCGILSGVLFPGEQTQVNIRTSGVKPAAAVAQPAESVKIGPEGIKVKDGEVDVEIGVTGVTVKEREEGEKIYEKGGLTVETSKKKKGKKDEMFPLVWLIYSILFLSIWGTTPAGRVFKLAVRQMDGDRIQWKDALVRSLFSLVSAYALLLGFLWALWQKDGRGWHDLIAGTRVVRVE